MEENKPFPEVNPVFKSFLQIITLIGLYMVFAIIAVTVASQITRLITGVNIQLDIEQLDYSNLNSHAIFGYKLFQLIASIGTFIVTALVFAKFFAREKLEHFFGFSGVFPSPKILGLTFIIALSAIPLLSYIVYLNKQIPLPDDIAKMATQLQTSNDAFYKVMLQTPSIGVLFFNLLVVALVPAIGEELLFRGAFMQLFYRFFKDKIHAAIIIVAVLFSAMHLQYYSFLGIILMGIVFGYLYYWSGNIMVSIWAHFINNGTIVLFAYLTEHNPDLEFMTYDYEFSPLVSLISGAVMVGAIYLFYKTTRQYHAIEEIDTSTEED